jgi:hypothetical protein
MGNSLKLTEGRENQALGVVVPRYQCNPRPSILVCTGMYVCMYVCMYASVGEMRQHCTAECPQCP